jgi:hypothetical protein
LGVNVSQSGNTTLNSVGLEGWVVTVTSAVRTDEVKVTVEGFTTNDWAAACDEAAANSKASTANRLM